ncbi:MAG: 1,2-phenylacetyl-CoA epoxidase subunit PaaC [Bacillota bacterium]|nr:1,2-phenylacetyl-CoA epoxidase subunit PaaC [Bacillota bacterium]
MKILTPEEAIKNNAYKNALTELLYQLADDDFILSYRGSEWLGLAPHIEEDVAFSSINQDTMGHAAMFYQLLENLGEGKMDGLAHNRPANRWRNACLLEKVNGTGHYLNEPKYDWAFAVCRHYFYTSFKKIRMESLKTSSYQPLADAAVRVSIELFYHQLHWKTWFQQLMLAGGEAKTRMEKAIQTVCNDFGGVLGLGSLGESMVTFSLIDSEETIKNRWNCLMESIFEGVSSSLPETLGSMNGDGRNGVHTQDLEAALKTLSEVYQLDPTATW